MMEKAYPIVYEDMSFLDLNRREGSMIDIKQVNITSKYGTFIDIIEACRRRVFLWLSLAKCPYRSSLFGSRLNCIQCPQRANEWKFLLAGQLWFSKSTERRRLWYHPYSSTNSMSCMMWGNWLWNCCFTSRSILEYSNLIFPQAFRQSPRGVTIQ